MKEVLNLPVFIAPKADAPGRGGVIDFSGALAIHSTPLRFAGPCPQRRAFKAAVKSAASKRYRQSQRLSHNGPLALDIYL